MTGRFEVVCGDALHVLRGLPDGLVQCCVTSPPYWGLRDYGVPARTWDGAPDCEHEWGGLERGRRGDLLPADRTSSEGRLGVDERQAKAGLEGGRFCVRCGAWHGCLGLEPTPQLYATHLVEVFRQVRRVLRDDGSLWLVLGDSYAAARTSQSPDRKRHHPGQLPPLALPDGAKPKDLLGIPWQVAFALRADGWWLRADVVWAKRNPIPESVTDRPTRAHEYVFLLAKRGRYFYDRHAVREPDCGRPAGNGYQRPDRLSYRDRYGPRGQSGCWQPGGGRNRRDVWTLASRPFKGGHIATFPPDLVEPCVLAGSSPIACGACGAPYGRAARSEHEATAGRRRRERLSSPLDPCRGARTRSPHREGPRPLKAVGFEAGCAHHDPSGRCLVLDPFCGSGTTGLVALRHGRGFLGIELNPAYARMARERVAAAGSGRA